MVKITTATNSSGERLIRGEHAEDRDLWAAWDPKVVYVEPGVRSSRFAAWLAPFPSREAAELALIQAGAVIGAISDGQ